MSPSWGAVTATCFLTNFSPAGGRGAALPPGSCCAWTAEQTRRGRSLWTGAPRACFPGAAPCTSTRTSCAGMAGTGAMSRGTGVASPSTATGVARGRPARGMAPSPLPRLRDRQPPSVRRGSSCGVFIDALASSFLFPVRWELFSSLKSCLCGQRCCAHTVVAVRVPFLRLRQRELPVPLHSRASLEKSRFLLSLRFRVLIAGVSSGL